MIFSGDGNFTRLVVALQRRGCKVSVVSTMASRPPMILDALPPRSRYFIDLVKLRSEISRAHSESASNSSELGHAVLIPEAWRQRCAGATVDA
ncbi:NYN domain-containing protein [Sinorhizobium meliloti]|nr:NYN domain-containing protein [Sinorhizobium meliloti]